MSVYQHCTLQQVADLIQAKVIRPDVAKAYCSYLCREEHFDQAAHDASLPILEVAWKGIYSTPDHSRLCGLTPELFAMPSRTQWPAPASDGSVELSRSELEDMRREAISEGRSWLATFTEDAQFVFSRVQHHWHALKDGKRVPLNYCKPKSANKPKSSVCKSGFPKRCEITACALLVCQGIASKFKLRISGRRNALGSILRKRSCVWNLVYRLAAVEGLCSKYMSMFFETTFLFMFIGDRS